MVHSRAGSGLVGAAARHTMQFHWVHLASLTASPPTAILGITSLARGVTMAAPPDLRTQVAIFTDRHCLLADLATGPRRLSEVLNDGALSHLALERVRVTRPAQPNVVVAHHPHGLLRKTAVQGVVIIAEPPRGHQRLAAYVVKPATRVVLLLNALEVAGAVHIEGKMAPLVFALDGPGAFLAVTEAVVTAPIGGTAPRAAGIVLVNRARIEMAALET